MSDLSLDIDTRVRIAALDFMARETQIHGDVLCRSTLARGFDFNGTRVPLVGPQGIFKPALLRDMPLTITTVPPVEGRERPYEDDELRDGMLGYKYRGQDPEHRDNVGLRLAMQRRVPLIYLYGLVPGHYAPVWPVYIVGDDPAALTFAVAVDQRRFAALPAGQENTDRVAARRQYVTMEAQRRLHQQGFRTRVLRAYRERCAVCLLKHPELLEAAHILPDWHPQGMPVVPNGLSLCRLHHGAFDRHILGVRPDHVIEIRRDILDEEDGPMLTHGLQGFQSARIHVPTAPAQQPAQDFLEARYEMFRKAV